MMNDARDIAHVSLNLKAETLEDFFESNFNDFLRSARGALCNNGTDFEKLHGVAYLRVRLDVDDGSLYLYIRRSDIYLVAVRVLGEGWYEFKPSGKEKKNFREATELPFEASYTKITGNPKDNQGGKKKDNVTDINLDKYVFARVVWDLISQIRSHDPNDKQKVKDMRGNILKIIVFVSEAIRIDQIAKFILRTQPYIEPQRQIIMDFVSWMIRSWETMTKSASAYKLRKTPKEKEIADQILKADKNIIDDVMKKQTDELCAIVLGEGIRCGYLKEDKETKKHKIDENKKTKNKSDPKKKPKTGVSK